MHTFFINTSKRKLNDYDVLFDIHYENKTLVSMDCQMSDWFDAEKGYVSCVSRMSDLIDGYVELNNSFNLIIYIDLLDNTAYSSIPRDAFHDKDRDECCRAMHILFTHIISESIVGELVNSGRKPCDVLIMFGEEKRFVDFAVAASDASRSAVMKYLFDFIGLPTADVIEKTAKEADSSDGDDKVEMFRRKIEDQCGKEIVPGIRKRYDSVLRLWYDEVINEANIPKANSGLFDRINDINRAETDRIGVETISCPYDLYASKVNKSALAISQLNIALYLLECVETESIYESGTDAGRKKLIDFHLYTVDEIAPIFLDKEKMFSAKAEEIDSLAESYVKLKLSPPVMLFDHAKFGLDQYGNIDTKIIITDVKPDEKTRKKEKDDKTEPTDKEDDDAIKFGIDKETVLVEKNGRKLFSAEEYPSFDYCFDQDADKLYGKNASPEEYIERAIKTRKFHLDYLKKLKNHISERLSNYAGKSKENKPALLKVGGYQYAAPGQESRVIETVAGISEKAYETMLTQYMEFCAGRTVAVTDIEDQCNWFISRVNQIRESLKKLKLVAVGMLAALILLYTPFVIIQFEAIVENIFTVAAALASFAVPVVLLGVVYSIAALAQRKKYIKVWKEFKEKSDQALEDNKITAEKYDRLLSAIIPALRWVYEYKLDVEYCLECCDVADAKVEHHRRKLRKRVMDIRNILSDLEYKGPDREEEQISLAQDAVDYTVSFCSGKKNCGFYSVIDKKFFADAEKE